MLTYTFKYDFVNAGKNLNDTCSAGECITHASCVSTICVCDAGYTPSPATKPTMCKF